MSKGKKAENHRFENSLRLTVPLRYAIEAIEPRLYLSGNHTPSATLVSTQNTLYVGKIAEFVATYTDQDGAADLHYVYLRLDPPNPPSSPDRPYLPLTMLMTQEAGKITFSPWAHQEGDDYLEIGNSTAVIAQNEITVTWRFTVKSTWGLTASGIRFGVNAWDNSNAFFDWHYDDSSAAFLFPAPAIQTLSASPDIVKQGKTVRLTANSAIGDLVRVDFYRDPNKTRNPETALFLGSDTDSTGGWTWVGSTGDFPTGSNQYLARAEARDGTWSSVAIGIGTIDPPTVNPTKVVGYYPEYRYADGTNFNDIDLKGLTHLNYFRLIARSDGSLDTSKAAEDANITNLSHLDKMVAAAHAAGRTISIVIGLETDFMAIVTNPTSTYPTPLSNFVTNIGQFCTDHSLDGIDLDWEPLANPGIAPTTAQINSFGMLVDTLRRSDPQLLLSVAVNAHAPYTVPLSVVPEIDWIAVMGYDFTPGSNQSPYIDSIAGLEAWRAYGVPKSQLILGVPFYGYWSQGTSWANNQAKTYADIISDYFTANNKTYPDPNSDSVDGWAWADPEHPDKIPIPSSDPTIPPNEIKVPTTWSYNGISTIRNKTDYVMENQYAGMMIFDVSQDHFDSLGNYDQWSLLPQIDNIVLNKTINSAPSNLIADGFDYPIGSKGYDASGRPMPIKEFADNSNINEQNTPYSDAEIIANPSRGDTVRPGEWYDFQDVGAYNSDNNAEGIHSGEDWNYNNGDNSDTNHADDDVGQLVYAVAQGIVVDIRTTSASGNHNGWTIILLHTLPDGSQVYSIYQHVTYDSNNAVGSLATNSSQFSISIGELVNRGQPIARIGNTGLDHLHFEMRSKVEDLGPLYNKGNGLGYFTDIVGTPRPSPPGMSSEQVAATYATMCASGIIDPSDFIDAHRPPAWINASTGSNYIFGGITGRENLTVSSGTLTLTDDAASTHPNLAVILESGASMVFHAIQHLGSLILNSGASALLDLIQAGSLLSESRIESNDITLSANQGGYMRVNDLLIDPSAKLNLSGNDLIMDYSDVSPLGSWNGSNYSGVIGLVASGRNGGTWDGNGIISSAADATEYALGVAEAKEILGIQGSETASWDGEQVDATTLLIAYTRVGDANLDRTVNLLDLNALATNFGASSATYSQGDFDYSGTVGMADFNLLAMNFGTYLAPPATSTPPVPNIARPQAPAVAFSGIFADIPISKDNDLKTLLN